MRLVDKHVPITDEQKWKLGPEDEDGWRTISKSNTGLLLTARDGVKKGLSYNQTYTSNYNRKLLTSKCGFFKANFIFLIMINYVA